MNIIISPIVFVAWMSMTGSVLSQKEPSYLPPAEELEAISAEGLRNLPEDDPKLKQAYAALFIQRFERRPPWQVAIAEDLSRRGGKAMPTLLALFEENPDGEFREELLFGFRMYPSLDAAPILTRVRKLEREEGTKAPERTLVAVCRFLAEFGSAEDLAILERLAARDPKIRYVRPMALSAIKQLKKRLETTPPLVPGESKVPKL